MTKSELDSRFAQGDALITQIRDGQIERLRRVGDLWEEQLKDWHDLAKAEDSVRREYRGRYLFELLQNANDAITDALSEVNGAATRKGQNIVRVELTQNSLLVANCGLPFAENNIRALCRLHDTTKSASKQIGHKGIGFKSVLEITETPEVYSDRYAFGFNRQEFTAKVRQVIGAYFSNDTSLPVLRAPFPRRLSRLPPQERARIEQLLGEGDYVTVIRLPFESENTLLEVEKRMRAELRPQLLLFLNAIDQLQICFPSGEDVAFWREAHIESSGSKGFEHSDVSLWSDEEGKSHIDSHWLVLSPRELPISNRSLVQGLGEAWEEVQAVRCTVAFPLTPDGQQLRTDLPSQPFHVYFPTEEFCGLRFLVNADFYIEAARKDIRRNALNDWLAEELALYIGSAGVETLRARFPRDPAIVDILAPVQQPERDFGAHFYRQYLLALSTSEFVPLKGGQYKTPADIRFSPKGADAKRFREFFPPHRLRGQANWAFPLLEVEERELQRNVTGHAFLLKQLGATRIEIDAIAEVLRNGPLVSSVDCGEFLRFLAHWWNEMGGGERQLLVQALSECAIVPTHSGWLCPSKSLIFQANLREEKDIEVPEGFAFELVPLDVYGEERSYQGVPALFLQALGVNSYQAREILRKAILPRLTSPDSFQELTEHHPNAIYAAYAFLKDYYERERSTAEIQNDLPRVPVPAYRPGHPAESTWKPAGQAYFSAYWSGSDDLENIYGQFDDVYFLGPIDELEGVDDPDQRQAWYGFFAWLDVSHKPRLIEQSGSYTWDEVKHKHPFRSRRFWDQYLERFESKFQCATLGKNHGRTRGLGMTWALEHFEELASRENVGLLSRLFRLLGIYWEDYRHYLATELRCQSAPRSCVSDTIPSYLAYCLRETAWVPAYRWGQLAAHPFRGSDVWNLGEDVGPEVRQMLPSLPEDFGGDTYRAIRADVLKTEVGFDDYLNLLHRLPELCPLARDDLTGDALKKWRDAARAVFNWLGEAMQNGIVRKGEENCPKRPAHLKVLAYQGEMPVYVEAETPNLVYPDDPFLTKRWADELFYLKVEEGWSSWREWLGVAKLSERVTSEIQFSGRLETETDEIRRKYREALPYFLALVYEQQNSRFNLVLGRLQRLDVHVVEELRLQQEMPRLSPGLQPRTISERVYLKPRDDPNPRGGRAIRAGDLYISRTEMNNPDILGGHIANYIEIDRLGDAFVVLYGRTQHEGRMRYLNSRGISETVVMETAQRLKSDGDDGQLPSDYEALIQAFQNQESVNVALPIAGSEPQAPSAAPPGHQPPDERVSKPDEPEKPPANEPIELPPLDTNSPIGVETYTPEGTPAQPNKTDKPGRPGGGGHKGKFQPLSEEQRIRLGKRGEEWVYAAERQRLAALGLNPDALERAGRLDWVASRDRYAHYDIRSVDLMDGEMKEIYIEVKSTTGQDRTAEWSINEFRLASDKGDAYWLYWVGHVDRERPDLPVRYQNPVRRWKQGYIQLDFRQLEIALPKETEDSQ